MEYLIDTQCVPQKMQNRVICHGCRFTQMHKGKRVQARNHPKPLITSSPAQKLLYHLPPLQYNLLDLFQPKTSPFSTRARI